MILVLARKKTENKEIHELEVNLYKSTFGVRGTTHYLTKSHSIEPSTMLKGRSNQSFTLTANLKEKCFECIGKNSDKLLDQSTTNLPEVRPF
jgi:hypothetical protein